jgi:hypothetical protein
MLWVAASFAFFGLAFLAADSDHFLTGDLTCLAAVLCGLAGIFSLAG